MIAGIKILDVFNGCMIENESLMKKRDVKLRKPKVNKKIRFFIKNPVS